jgi:sec-independent protein translocase protein TatB
LFGGGFTDIGFILFIAFLLFGPKKLPEIARILGKGMGELRRASNELKFSLEEEIRNLDHKDDAAQPERNEASYPEEETYPYYEGRQKTFGSPKAEAHEVESQPEGGLETAQKYGYNHSESPHKEPGSRS